MMISTGTTDKCASDGYIVQSRVLVSLDTLITCGRPDRSQMSSRVCSTSNRLISLRYSDLGKRRKTRCNQDVSVISGRQKGLYVVRQRVLVVSTVFSIHFINNHQPPTVSRKSKLSQSSSCFRFDIPGILNRSNRSFRRRTETCVLAECGKTLHEDLVTIAVQSQDRAVHLLMLSQIDDSQLRVPDSAEAVHILVTMASQRHACQKGCHCVVVNNASALSSS